MSDIRPNRRERAAEFVGALRRTRNDRGKLAALRRGLSENPRMHVDAWPVVAGLGGDIAQRSYVVLAALFASHPEESGARNLGETCRDVSLVDGREMPESSERRFRRLLACGGEVEEVIRQLPTWIRLAAGKGIGVNYESLLCDLLGWEWAADEIRVRWARSFWKSGDQPDGVPNNPTSPSA